MSSVCTSRSSHKLVVVCGPTGVGKTRLGIELAKRFDGEVVNADAMQLYKGLDIATNKATPAEQNGVRHHLIGCLDPLTEIATVHQYRTRALASIADIHTRGRLPIVVGGTMYYIESILWDFLIDTGFNESHADRMESYSDMTTGELFAQLQSIDPSSAELLHPNNRRKILRAVEIKMSSGRGRGDHLAEQHTHTASLSGPLRFPREDVAIFYLACDATILSARILARIGAMRDAGLVREIVEFHAANHCHVKAPGGQAGAEFDDDYEHGVFQSIGFKEFAEYLALPPLTAGDDDHATCLARCLSRLHTSNMQYVRRQLRWIHNRFLARPAAESANVFRLDVSAALSSLATATGADDCWAGDVLSPATAVVTAVLAGAGAPLPLVPEIPSSRRRDTPEANYCEVCERRFVIREQFLAHLKSRPHQRRKAAVAKRRRCGVAETVASSPAAPPLESPLPAEEAPPPPLLPSAPPSKAPPDFVASTAAD